MEFSGFQPEYDFKKMLDDEKRQAAEVTRLQVNFKKRQAVLQAQSELQNTFQEIEHDAQEELNTNLQKIDNKYGESIEADRPIDFVQSVPGPGLSNGCNKPDSGGYHSYDEAQSPILGRVSMIPSSEVKENSSTKRSQSMASIADLAAPGSKSRKSRSREPSAKKTSLKG
ncbi:hypothetical protein PG993_014614 [Apiospora rasikravindrae]|uniref:Uncharacterized protein n=1 Tax=Apiospora rasikravindrae TaxID=990691 RepID=A0ABR1RN79_9PEZI